MRFKPITVRNVLIMFAILLLVSGLLFNLEGLIPKLSHEAVWLIFIFMAALILWLFVAIDWTSILILFALALLPSTNISGVMASSLGNNTIAFLIFSMILTYSLSSSGFLKRVAYKFIYSKFAGKGSWQFILMYLLSILIIGSFIAPTVLFILFYTLLQEIYAELNINKGDKFAKILMIGTAIVTSISCAMTPIAHTFPLMALGFYANDTGINISYIDYLKYGIPLGILLFGIFIGVVYIAFRKYSQSFPTLNLQKRELGPITPKELISLVVFALVVIAWLLIGIIPKQLPGLNALTTTGPAMLGTVLLCIIQTKTNHGHEPVLNFKEAINHGVSWPSIMLCACTLALGKYITSSDIGITAAIIGVIQPLFKNVNSSIIVLLIASLSIILTNIMSNIVTTTVLYNLVMPIIFTMIAAGTQLNAEIYTIMIGMGASLAFATPPAIAHIAIASGSGWATPKDMLKFGTIMSIISILVMYIIFTL